MKFIKLTDPEWGRYTPIWINAELIKHMRVYVDKIGNETTSIYTQDQVSEDDGPAYTVTETPEEILKLIAESEEQR